jgi:hypothetical protein
VQEPSPALEIAHSVVPSRRTRPPWSSYAPFLAAVFLVFAIVGLVAPSAEESAGASDGYPRAAYWACADLLAQRLGPAFDLDFPGDSTATITHEGPAWDVSGRVDIISEQQPVARNWSCTVTHDDGTWRGIAALE